MTYDPNDREGSAEEARRYRAAVKRRNKRDAQCADVSILDDYVDSISPVLSIELVSRVLDLRPLTLHNLLHRHSDEMFCSGWDPDTDTLTRPAVIRVCLFLRPVQSAVAAEIAERAGRKRPIKPGSGTNSAHGHVCRSMVKQSLLMVARVHDEDPAEVWHDLNQLDAYTLRGMVVALSAMVSPDATTEQLVAWLRTLPKQGREAAGLATLVPPRSESDGVPLSLTDDEAEGVAA
ncbi:helix-turn-helix DNA binding domain protein [Mycobacterium phage MalagasyRose]|uniref:Helix-turn-helix DNA binding domain protein n=1 Tax=Mycobacterium phage MalagasyRose TaxID=2599870 RepID=A0A5J6TGL4_9CAUD|nr:helix-turn-helix DNA binding domain protein [Mycobacterium phage MalagasyRose]QFG08899.1 helix-turn-helix DNA binding domain protein [Mycobacterium phage MalagasyRose]